MNYAFKFNLTLRITLKEKHLINHLFHHLTLQSLAKFTVQPVTQETNASIYKSGIMVWNMRHRAFLKSITHQLVDSNVCDTYLCDSLKESAIAVDNHHKRENKAEDKQTDDVRHVVGCPGSPVDAAGGAGTLRTVAAPSKQRWNSPNHGIYPGEGNTHGHLSVIGRVGLRGPHHGAVALVREHRQGN